MRILLQVSRLLGVHLDGVSSNVKLCLSLVKAQIMSKDTDNVFCYVSGKIECNEDTRHTTVCCQSPKLPHSTECCECAKKCKAPHGRRGCICRLHHLLRLCETEAM